MTRRIFVGVVEVAGYYSALVDGLRQLGTETSFVCLSDNPFGYEEGVRTENLLTRALRDSLRHRAVTPRRQFLRKLFWLSFSEICRAAVFIWAALRHDVFVLGSGTSLYGLQELPLLRWLARRIVCVFHGSDCRPPYIDGARIAIDPRLADDVHYLHRKSAAVKRMVERVDRYADAVVSTPPQALFQSKPFILYQAVGVPVRMPQPAFSGGSKYSSSRAIRILHCPSSPQVKGTDAIRAAVAALKSEGHVIDYTEITGKPNSTVMKELAECDFIVDQLYSDTPAATLVAEAAFLGKPAVVAGECKPFIDTLSTNYAPPTIYCSPDEIKDEIERLIVDADLRKILGKRAQEFVMARWTPIEVAKRFLSVITGEIPDDWMCDPYEINYVPIVGMSKESARAVIRQLIDNCELSALQLTDKPKLQQLFVEFARGEGH